MSEQEAKNTALKINNSLQYIATEARDGLRTWASTARYLIPELGDRKLERLIDEQIAERVVLKFKESFQRILVEAIEGNLTWERANLRIFEELDRLEIEIAGGSSVRSS